MANAKFNLKSELGGITTVTTSDTANSGTVIFPESGRLATEEYIDINHRTKRTNFIFYFKYN